MDHLLYSYAYMPDYEVFVECKKDNYFHPCKFFFSNSCHVILKAS